MLEQRQKVVRQVVADVELKRLHVVDGDLAARGESRELVCQALGSPTRIEETAVVPRIIVDPSVLRETERIVVRRGNEPALSRTTPRPIRDGRGFLLETTVGDGSGTVTVTAFKGAIRLYGK